MVVRRMSARDARTHFADVLGSVHYSREQIIVERKGKPFAVVLAPSNARSRSENWGEPGRA